MPLFLSEEGTEGLLVWGGRKHPYSQTQEVFVSRLFHSLPLEIQNHWSTTPVKIAGTHGNRIKSNVGGWASDFPVIAIDRTHRSPWYAMRVGGFDDTPEGPYPGGSDRGWNGSRPV